MYKAYSQIFWGAVITIFNINIGWLNLLPNFAGYILIAVGLSKIIANNTNNVDCAKKAKAIAWVLAVYSFVIMFVNEAFSGVTNSLLTTVFMTADMLMCFFILSADVHGDGANRETISKQQRIYLIITTIAIVLSCMTIMIPGILWVTLIFSFASKIYFLCLCHIIKKQFIRP